MNGVRIVLIAAFAAIGSTLVPPLTAQDHPKPISIAILRLKSSEETPERRRIVKDLATDLAAAFRENGSFATPEDAAVLKAIKGEGLRPEQLLSQEKCFDAGKELGVDYVVVGSAIMYRFRWHACVRVLSVKEEKLVATADAEYPVDQIGTMFRVLASKTASALATSPRSYDAGEKFSWKGEYLLPFGKHRIDLEPPALIYVNADPPFEISIKADMAVGRGSHAVTNFEAFVDDEGIGSIHPGLGPPIPVRQTDWRIGERQYSISLDLKEMRVFAERTEEEEFRFITSATIVVKVEAMK